MIQLAGVLWMMAIFFGIIGFLRGMSKEFIAMAGIILALFGLFQFDTYLRQTLLVNVSPAQVFILQSGAFAFIVFLAYQTRALGVGEDDKSAAGRDNLQSSIIGALLGFLNGYLIWGSIWYFLDINRYPLAPYVIAPPDGSPSEAMQRFLPLMVLAGGPTGSGDYLALAVIILFVIVLFII
jgi:hypothetical protein